MARYDGARVFGWTLLRVGAALLFMEHGAQKLFGLLGGINGRGARAGFPSLFGVAGPIEFFGGALLAVGLFTRPVAVITALEMLGAFLKEHLPHGPWPILNKGELALLYLIIWIFLVTQGAGPISLDRLFFRRRQRSGLI